MQTGTHIGTYTNVHTYTMHTHADIHTFTHTHLFTLAQLVMKRCGEAPVGPPQSRHWQTEGKALAKLSVGDSKTPRESPLGEDNYSTQVMGDSQNREPLTESPLRDERALPSRIPRNQFTHEDLMSPTRQS